MSISSEPSAQIFIDAELVAPREVEFAGGHAVIVSRRCPGRETANEDAAALLRVGPGQGVIIVADGCGGMSQGDVASKMAVEALEEAVSSFSPDSDNLRTAILDGIERANRNVMEIGSGAATTLAVVQIDGPEVRPYHVGDSEILVVGNRGKVKLQTTSHSPVGYAVGAGMLNEHEAIHHEDRHLVLNVLGMPDARIEIGSARTLHPRDTVLVGSDGLFDNVLLSEIINLIRKGPLDRAAARLADLATERMLSAREDLPSKPDDLTFVIYRGG